MQWQGNMASPGLQPGVALRVQPAMWGQGDILPDIAGGDVMFVAPTQIAHIRTDVVQAYQDWAILRDPAGVCWRIHKKRKGELTAPIQVSGPFQDWTVEGAVDCPAIEDTGE